MKKYEIYSSKNDLIGHILKTKLKVKTTKRNSYVYKTIYFKGLDDKNLIMLLKKELIYFFRKMNISKKSHIFVVGIGNDNHTADSVGPKVLKNINVNAYLNNIGIKITGNKVSALEPGVLGETGIKTGKIIRSVVKDIKPDLVIIIDSFICNDIKLLNSCIEINNEGVNTGCGINGIDSYINKEFLGKDVLVIGIPTAFELFFSKKKENTIPYLLTSKDIDVYVDNISKVIAKAINEAIFEI